MRERVGQEKNSNRSSRVKQIGVMQTGEVKERVKAAEGQINRRKGEDKTTRRDLIDPGRDNEDQVGSRGQGDCKKTRGSKEEERVRIRGERERERGRVQGEEVRVYSNFEDLDR